MNVANNRGMHVTLIFTLGMKYKERQWRIFETCKCNFW